MAIATPSKGKTWQLWVVDKNFLETDELEGFFLQSKNNYVVLTEFSGIEGYAGNPVKNMSRSMARASKYPNQVLVLKNIRAIAKLGAVVDMGMIDWRQTYGFGAFSHALGLAAKGSDADLRVIRENHSAATAHLDYMSKMMPSVIDFVEAIGESIDPAILQARRRMESIPAGAGVHLVRMMMTFASKLFVEEGVPELPDTPARAKDYYVFRFSAAIYLLGLRWLQTAGFRSAKPETLRNDFVDLSYVTSATYFDGLLTKDLKMLDIYAELLVLVEDIFPKLI